MFIHCDFQQFDTIYLFLLQYLHFFDSKDTSSSVSFLFSDDLTFPAEIIFG